jgi:ankyrin repeat protein
MNNQQSFMNAVKNGHTSIAKEYIHLEMNKECYNEALQISARRGYIELVKLLLKQKETNINSDNSEALILAVQYDHFEVISLLLKEPLIDPVGICNIPIKSAYFNRNNKNLDLLWSHKKVKESLEKDDFQIYTELIKKDIIIKIKSF